MIDAARRWSWRTAILVSLAVFAVLSTAGAALADGTGQVPGITKEGHEMHNLYLLLLGLGLLVFVVIESAVIYMVIRYRRRGDALPPQTHGNNLLEIIWTTIPVVIVLILFVFSFIVLVDVEHESKPETLTVEVTGFQYQWQFTYCRNDLGGGGDAQPKAASDAYQGPCATQADEVTTIGTAKEEPTLVIPVNQPVEFRLKSDDVIHSFYIRDFLYKLDVIPGRDNKFTVTAKDKGEFIGQCAELCGLNHSLMRFHVRVVDRSDFDKFIADQAAGNKAASSPR